MKNYAILFIAIAFTLSGNSKAGIETYQTTDNTGLNKKERIDTVEKYLIDLSASIKNMENKLDENSKKIKALNELVNTMKEKSQEVKPVARPLGEVITSSKDANEIDKLKADVLSLKNKDIEKLKAEVDELSFTVKAIQSTLRSQEK